MNISRSFQAPGEYSGRDVIISAEQFASDVAASYAAGELVSWENEEDTNACGDDAIFYTVTIAHDEGHTTYNWEESL